MFLFLLISYHSSLACWLLSDPKKNLDSEELFLVYINKTYLLLQHTHAKFKIKIWSGKYLKLASLNKKLLLLFCGTFKTTYFQTIRSNIFQNYTKHPKRCNYLLLLFFVNKIFNYYYETGKWLKSIDYNLCRIQQTWLPSSTWGSLRVIRGLKKPRPRRIQLIISFCPRNRRAWNEGLQWKRSNAHFGPQTMG